MSSKVALIRPPNIVTATGWRISLPGVAASISNGTSRQRHQHRGEPLEATPDHQIAPERHPLPERQIDVVADLQDTVARRYTGQRDEADHGRDRERLACQPECDHRPDQGERHLRLGVEAVCVDLGGPLPERK
jgi:hypothetical protein